MMNDALPIRTEADYDGAIVEVAKYFESEPEPGSPTAIRFKKLLDQLETFEDEHYPMDAPGPLTPK